VDMPASREGSSLLVDRSIGHQGYSQGRRGAAQYELGMGSGLSTVVNDGRDEVIRRA